MPTPWPEHDGNAKNFALPGSRVKPSPPGGVENIHVFFLEIVQRSGENNKLTASQALCFILAPQARNTLGTLPKTNTLATQWTRDQCLEAWIDACVKAWTARKDQDERLRQVANS